MRAAPSKLAVYPNSNVVTPKTLGPSSGGWPVQVHPRGLERGFHRAAGAHLTSAPVRRGHVNEHLNARARSGQEPGYQRLRDIRVVAEQRADLGGHAAGSQHPVAGQSSPVEARERVAGRPLDPGPQEALPFRPEDRGVEGEELVERHRAQLNQIVRAFAAAHRAPADVAVGEHEATALVRALLGQHPVQADDPPAGASERSLEQRAPDAAAA